MDSINQDLLQVLRNVLTQLPSLLTLLVCLVIALLRSKRHPKVSMLAGLGMILIIFDELFYSGAYIWIPRLFFATGSDRDHQTFFYLLGLSSSLLFALSLGMLLIAIFIDRNQRVEGDAGA
ncbi:MAG: hypothetical protein ABJC10_07910 [Acidobacteriota bacterium]